VATLKSSTAEHYVRLLEAAFVTYRLPAWGTTLRARSSAKPKLHFVDSGLAGRMLRITEARLSAVQPQAMTELGHLLETFCVGEVLRQGSWMDPAPHAGHWRTHDGDEVDLGARFLGGVVIHLGSRAYTEEDRLHALPADRLWLAAEA
jgi:predicted AAA+ superfamily ATPase